MTNLKGALIGLLVATVIVLGAQALGYDFTQHVPGHLIFHKTSN